MKIICNAVHAKSDLKTWEEYVQGHTKVLSDFGIEVLTSHGYQWLDNPNVYIVTARDELGQMIGGIKVHKVHADFELPVEKAISYVEPRIQLRIKEAEQFGAGEICGLWIAKNYGRRGMAHFLTRVAIAICEPLNIQQIFGISSPFTLNMFLSLGYTVISEYGRDGNFSYPTPEFISTAVEIRDTYILESAESLHKSRIFSLRKDPVQSAVEEHNGIISNFQYNLIIKTS